MTISDNIIQLNEDLIKNLVRSSVEETLNALLDHEADELVNASKYERTENQKAYEHIETWRSQKLTGEYAYVYVDGIYLKRSWGGEVQNVSVLVAMGVSTDGYREIIGAAQYIFIGMSSA